MERNWVRCCFQGMRVINIVGFRRGYNFLNELLGLAKPFGKVVKHLVLDLRPEVHRTVGLISSIRGTTCCRVEAELLTNNFLSYLLSDMNLSCSPVSPPEQAYLQFETEEEAQAMAKFYSNNITASVCGRPVRISHSMSYPTIQVKTPAHWLQIRTHVTTLSDGSRFYSTVWRL